MLKGKKKTKKKPKLVAGAVLGMLGGTEATKAPNRYGDEELYKGNDETMNMVGSIPLIGGLTSSAMGMSSAVRGDGTNALDNFGATIFDPTSAARSISDSGGSGGEQALAMINPIWGAVEGAKMQEKAIDRFRLKQQAQVDKGLIANSGTRTLKGGGSLSSKFNVVQGGQLEKISPDAVQVKANDPSKTDSVELDQAFVDHNEIIDRKNRVFSAERKGPSGKSFAAEAKTLEKMKGMSSRFNPANEMLESRLDDLFKFQEATKPMDLAPAPADATDRPQVTTKYPSHSERTTEFVNAPDKRQYVKDLAAKKYQIRMEQGAQSYYDRKQEEKMKTSTKAQFGSSAIPADNTKFQLKKKLDNGGRYPWDDPYMPNQITNATSTMLDPMMTNVNSRLNTQMAGQQVAAKPVGQKPIGSTGGMSGMDIAGAAVSAAPNLANAFLQTRLKGPAAPNLESDIRLNRLTPDAELAQSGRAFNQAKSAIIKNTAQGANVTAGVGSLLSAKLNAQNDMYGNLNRLNSQIGNQEAFANQQTRGRNIDRLNAFKQGQVDFSNAKVGMTSANIADLSHDFQSFNKERNLRERDSQSLAFLNAAYGDSQVMARLEKENPALYKSLYSSLGKKFSKGGKLNTKKK